MDDSAFHELDQLSSDSDIAAEFLTPVGTPSRLPETHFSSQGIRILLSHFTYEYYLKQSESKMVSFISDSDQSFRAILKTVATAGKLYFQSQ